MGRQVTVKETEAIERLLQRAEDKADIALLLLNAYNSFKYKVDLRFLMRYAMGEPDSVYERDLFRFFRFLKRGIELHEVVERSRVDALIKRWSRWLKENGYE